MIYVTESFYIRPYFAMHKRSYKKDIYELRVQKNVFFLQ